MTPVLDGRPWLAAALGSVAVLALSYVAARLTSHLLGRIVARRGSGPRSVRHELVDALDGPVSHTLFLIGARVAVHRAPLPSTVQAGLDSVLFVIGVVLVAVALSRSYRIFLAWYAARPQVPGGNDLAREFNPLFSMAGTIFIGLLAVITVLQRFGVNVASLVVSLGVGSLAIGLAAQDTLSNMFAGFTLMLDRPFRAGDRIQLASGETGDVEAIGMRATLIRTPDETTLVVPNSVLVKERLVNLSRPTRSVTARLDVGVAYGSDLERAKRILAEAARSSDLVDATREPVVTVNRFGEHAVHARLTFWVNDYTQQGLALDAVHVEAYRRLAEAGIEIPVVDGRMRAAARPAAGA